MKVKKHKRIRVEIDFGRFGKLITTRKIQKLYKEFDNTGFIFDLDNINVIGK